MEKFGKSQSVTRREDVRFLTGEGRYVDDIAPEGALQCFVFRAPVAHGVITELDVSDARTAQGVHAVYTLADLEAAGMNVGMEGATVPNRDGTQGAAPERPILARKTMRFVGEPIAVVVADTLAQARDAAELIVRDQCHVCKSGAGCVFGCRRQPRDRKFHGAAWLLCRARRRQIACGNQRTRRVGAQRTTVKSAQCRPRNDPRDQSRHRRWLWDEGDDVPRIFRAGSCRPRFGPCRALDV